MIKSFQISPRRQYDESEYNLILGKRIVFIDVFFVVVSSSSSPSSSWLSMSRVIKIFNDL